MNRLTPANTPALCRCRHQKHIHVTGDVWGPMCLAPGCTCDGYVVPGPPRRYTRENPLIDGKHKWVDL